jgi:hypothetical protein
MSIRFGSKHHHLRSYALKHIAHFRKLLRRPAPPEVASSRMNRHEWLVGIRKMLVDLAEILLSDTHRRL